MTISGGGAQRMVGDIGPQHLEDAGQLYAVFTTLAAITEGDPVYLNSSGFIGRASANASSTMHAIGVASAGGALSGQPVKVVVQGRMHSANYNFSGFLGANAYVPTAAGAPRTTPPGGPSASGNLVQQIGYFIDGSGLYVSIGPSFQRGGSLN